MKRRKKIGQFENSNCRWSVDTTEANSTFLGSERKLLQDVLPV